MPGKIKPSKRKISELTEKEIALVKEDEIKRKLLKGETKEVKDKDTSPVDPFQPYFPPENNGEEEVQELAVTTVPLRFLKPSDVAQAKIKRGEGKVSVSFPKTTFEIFDYSENGVEMGSKSGKIFMKLNSARTDDNQVVPDLKTYVKNIKDLAREMTYLMTEEIHTFSDWMSLRKNGQPPRLAVDENSLITSYVNGGVAVCFFPNSKNTKIQERNSLTRKTQEVKRGIIQFVGTTGNSHFFLEVSIRTIEFYYEKKDHSIKSTLYANVEELVWFNNGQDTAYRPPKKESLPVSTEKLSRLDEILKKENSTV